MNFRNLHLDYKDENGDVRCKLKNGVYHMKNAERFSAEEFYSSLDNVVRILSPNNSFKSIEVYPRSNGPSALLFYFFKRNEMQKGFGKGIQLSRAVH